MSRYLSLLLIACISLCYRSASQLYPFVNYTPKDGLAGNRVRHISQDSKGKLYFATANGLSVYDGSRFTNYSSENGLSFDMVNGITEAGPDSVLIILNSTRLQYLHKGRVHNYPLADSFCPVINQLVHCSDGHDYAIADEGLFRLEKNRFWRVP